MLALPAASFAQDIVAPTDNSGIDQYVEDFPSPSGDKPTVPQGSGGSAGSGGGGVAGGRLSQGDVASLRAQGPAGRAAARLFGAAPREGARKGGGGRRDDRRRSKRDQATGASTGEPQGQSGLSAILAAFGGDDGGMGPLLPVLLGAIALVTVLAGLRRRARRRSV